MFERVSSFPDFLGVRANFLTAHRTRRREYWMIYSRPGFLAVVWFGSSPIPLPPTLPSVNAWLASGNTQEDWERDTTCWQERGEGWWRSQIILPLESLASINHSRLKPGLYKSFKTLCKRLYTGTERRWETRRWIAQRHFFVFPLFVRMEFFYFLYFITLF